ncbi:hypothetical protein [Haloferula rosea]|uniref:Uncharacterized protein n=1 Tax=Haloferula rosea TaxID=490093 RepID=A0A934RF78_9BACT|nr:hypothetical protein [Haloferula rosea]MBK1827295.1 hypothetical protein [Haloferula rosea]
MTPEDPQPIVPDPGVENRSLSTGEQFLLWAGILMPGLTSPFFLIAWFGIGYARSTLYEVWIVVLPILWVAILVGCCFLCGWIHAVKRGPEGRTQRAWKACGLFVLGQIILTPTLGFGCCMLVVNLNMF